MTAAARNLPFRSAESIGCFVRKPASAAARLHPAIQPVLHHSINPIRIQNDIGTFSADEWTQETVGRCQSLDRLPSVDDVRDSMTVISAHRIRLGSRDAHFLTPPSTTSHSSPAGISVLPGCRATRLTRKLKSRKAEAAQHQCEKDASHTVSQSRQKGSRHHGPRWPRFTNRAGRNWSARRGAFLHTVESANAVLRHAAWAAKTCQTLDQFINCSASNTGGRM